MREIRTSGSMRGEWGALLGAVFPSPLLYRSLKGDEAISLYLGGIASPAARNDTSKKEVHEQAELAM
jgi:hypothetical protein